MINFSEVSKSIKNKEILTNINFKFHKGNAYLLRGHNGSGKTMLLRLICNLIQPSEGVIERGVTYQYGVIIENPSFFTNETAFYNLKYLAKINNSISNFDIDNVLKKLNLYEHRDSKVKSFSLGMIQRLAICQSIMESPDVLLLDEPFNALDEANVEVLKGIIETYRDEGKLVVVAAHSLPFNIEGVFDKVLTLNNGKIVSVQTG